MDDFICKEHKLCTGCGACYSICPVNAIIMKDNMEGFFYPEIDDAKCIDCKLCTKNCPINSAPDVGKFNRISFVARTKDEQLLNKCTSGGIFTTLAKKFIENGYSVFGVIYDDEFNVIHKRITDVEDIDKLAGSKYVQSWLGDTFKNIKELLDEGNKVLFCGTPCQVAGLYNFLRGGHKNLYLVDLVCHGVPSPKLWKSYLEYIQNKEGKLLDANFRSKKLGYHVSVMEEKFVCGKSVIGSARTNLMSKCFFKNIADRYCCYDCKFKTVERVSDLTIYDSWHASELVENLNDDDKGYTNIIVQSDKGYELINKYLKDCILLYPSKTDVAIKLDGCMAVRSVNIHPDRDYFYQYLNENGIYKTVSKFLPISKWDVIIEKMKKIIAITGMQYKIKKLRK